MNRRVISVAVLSFWLASGFGFPTLPGTAAGPTATQDLALPGTVASESLVSGDPSSPTSSLEETSGQVRTETPSTSLDLDYDGLPDDVETDGWSSAAGFFITDPLDRDSDDDGLTDGEEKIYSTDPLNDHSPGIYVEYEDHLKTRQYSVDRSYQWGWRQYGDRLISFDAVVVRRGATFFVGGPADATIQIDKTSSSLSTLTPVRHACAGRWRISVSSGGTVGKYRITVRQGSWTSYLNLYVIFELPSPTSSFNQAMIDTFLYDDDPANPRDEIGILLNSNGYEYTYYDYPHLIPYGKWVNAGQYYKFNLQQFEPFVFEQHVIGAINGCTSQWQAARALVARADKVTRFGNPRPFTTSWQVLHPGTDDMNQCSNISGLVTAFERSAGIPARPFFVDWVHRTFDHAAEIWINGTWYAARGYTHDEPEGCGWNCAYGYNPPQSRYSWGRDRYRPWHSGGGGSGSVIAAADETWPWDLDYGHQYRWPSWDWDTIVRKPWAETLFVPYWSYFGWRQEPRVTGTPPDDWPGRTYSAADASVTGHTITPADTSSLTPTPPFDDTPDDVENDLVARGVSDYAVDLDGDGYFDQLLVEIEIEGAQPGTYWIQGQLGPDHPTPSLALTGGIVAAATFSIHLSEGTNTIQLPFQGLQISASKTDGPYSLKVLSITDVDNPGPEHFANNSLGHWASLYNTDAYQAYDFENWGALLSGHITERGIDADGDELYESLTLDVGLDILRPGTYTLQGTLYDSHRRFVGQETWTGTDSTASLHFDQLQSTVGPYTLEEISLLNTDGDIIDSRVESYATQQVVKAEGGTRILHQPDSGEFGLQDILPDTYSDSSVDLDGDGLYDLLVIEVQVEIDEPGRYALEGWLKKETYHLVSWARSDTISLTVGTHPISLAFSGPAINAHHADGPFTLADLRLLKGDGYQVVDAVDIAYTTAAYTHSQFEGLPYLVLPADHILLLEDHMEDSGGDWTPDYPWARVTTRCHSPSHAWTDSPNGNYADERDVSLTTGPMDTHGFGRPTLQFQSCHQLETDYDYGYVEVSTDAGVTWTSVATYTGSTAQWAGETLDLGETGDAETLQVRFRLVTDAGVTADGWYIDSVAIYTDTDLDDDGIPNAVEAGDDPDNPVDSDGDGTPDYLDEDSDDNDIPDAIEGTGDNDGDSIPDYADLDDNDGPDGDIDGDTILNKHEDIVGLEDADDDDALNKVDTDSDNDSIPDQIEAGDSDPTTPPVDTDADNLPDFIDLDSDSDDKPDRTEGTDDSDGDSIPNYRDPEFNLWLPIYLA